MLRIHTVCATCAQQLDVTTPGQRTHPGCTPPYSHEDQLVADFLAAVEAEDDPLADQLEHALNLIDAAPVRLAEAALVYAAWGWPVFPLAAEGKVPLPKCGQCRSEKCEGPDRCHHELCHGFKDATCDPGMVRRWWEQHPNANIGLATGHRFDVLDVDTPAGIWSWADMRDSDGELDVHAIATTPSAGLHIYVTPTGGGNMSGFRPGLDYRGVGGYVVAPPSVRGDHNRYRWQSRPSPSLTAAPAVEKAA